jgi:hypothetical protein
VPDGSVDVVVAVVVVVDCPGVVGVVVVEVDATVVVLVVDEGRIVDVVVVEGGAPATSCTKRPTDGTPAAFRRKSR